MDAIKVEPDSGGKTTESHVNDQESDCQEDGICQPFAFAEVKVEVELDPQELVEVKVEPDIEVNCEDQKVDADIEGNFEDQKADVDRDRQAETKVTSLYAMRWCGDLVVSPSESGSTFIASMLVVSHVYLIVLSNL
jgi:hypothetical protein